MSVENCLLYNSAYANYTTIIFKTRAPKFKGAKIKIMKPKTYRMHIEHVNIQIVSCNAETFKHLKMTFHMSYKAISEIGD